MGGLELVAGGYPIRGITPFWKGHKNLAEQIWESGQRVRYPLETASGKILRPGRTLSIRQAATKHRDPNPLAGLLGLGFRV